MTSLLRTYLAISLALMLALTGQSMAVARGSTGPAGQMMLCTGTGPVAVYVDETGAPVGPPAFCPDCALTHLTAIATPDLGDWPVPARPVVLTLSADPIEKPRGRSRAMARAPPFMVLRRNPQNQTK